MIIRQGLVRRVVAGMSFSTLTILVIVIGQVVAVPIFLKGWGVDVYGEWLVLTGTVTALSLLNLGIQSYVINVLIAKYLHRELSEGTRIFQSAFLIYLIVGLFSLMILVGMLVLPGILPALNIQNIPLNQARVILIVYGLIAVYGIFGGLLMGLFRVVQQTPRQMAYGLFERLIFLFVPMFVVLLGGSPLTAAVCLGFFFLA